MSDSEIADFAAARTIGAAPFRLAIILVPRFALMSFASVVEPARGANRLSGRKLYEWDLFGPAQGNVESNGGIEVAAKSIAELDPGVFDMVIVCAATHAESKRYPSLEAAVRRLHRAGLAVAAVSTGSFLLARAGLLGGRRCTVHWDYADSFREAFPDVDLLNDLFVVDGRILTCAGATAALDMMLELIQCHHGRDLARQIADQFLHGGIRGATEGQRQVLLGGAVRNAVVQRAVQRMEATVEEPVSPARLARELGVSQRQLERLSKRYLGCTPAKFHAQLRLQRARRMLRQTELSVAEIAIACGFVSLSHFAKAYRRQFSVSPRQDRQAA
ncbi:GlxA family transcriptional regulator [Dongia sp.]|uniref:GlxA family transcriptional regulator n=1 Tax=Dongia sp. TaxID=1977262 RepID=UPI0035B35640